MIRVRKSSILILLLVALLVFSGILVLKNRANSRSLDYIKPGAYIANWYAYSGAVSGKNGKQAVKAEIPFVLVGKAPFAGSENFPGEVFQTKNRSSSDYLLVIDGLRRHLQALPTWQKGNEMPYGRERFVFYTLHIQTPLLSTGKHKVEALLIHTKDGTYTYPLNWIIEVKEKQKVQCAVITGQSTLTGDPAVGFDIRIKNTCESPLRVEGAVVSFPDVGISTKITGLSNISEKEPLPETNGNKPEPAALNSSPVNPILLPGHTSWFHFAFYSKSGSKIPKFIWLDTFVKCSANGKVFYAKTYSPIIFSVFPLTPQDTAELIKKEFLIGACRKQLLQP